MNVFRFVFKIVTVATILLLSIPEQAAAREMLVPSYKVMLAKSDLVVIANPMTKTTDTKEESFLPGISQQDKDGKQSKISSIGVETIFAVVAVIKGDAAMKQFTLHHYRKAQPGPGIDDPDLVSFDPSDLSKRSSYLLFLVREPDGRFAPIGGQTDPGFKSVIPIPFELLMAQQANVQTGHEARVRALQEQLRWGTESERTRYEAKKTELTGNLLAEIDQYIAERFVPGSTTAEQVQSRLNELLGYGKGLGIQNVAFLVNLPKGEFLITGIDLWRGGAAVNEDYITFRAYLELDGRFVRVASTGNLSDSTNLVSLHAGALAPSPTAGEFWFIAWAEVPPQSPYTIAIRLYAFDGAKFRTVWAPRNIIAAGTDTAVRVGSRGVFTVNQMPTWMSQKIVHEQYAVFANGPKKVKEWESTR